jgi:hypothetical protein
MSLIVKTLVKDGLGTEAKMIVANSDDDWKALKEFILEAANHIVPTSNMVDLIDTLEKSK